MPIVECIPFGPGFWSRIAGDWGRAVARDPEASAFLSAEWIGSWVEAYGAALRPDALLWRDADGRIAGACLLSLARGALGPFVVRRAWVNATGEDEVLSEHNRIVGAPEGRAQMVQDLVAEAARRAADQLMLSGFVRRDAEAVLATWRAGTAVEGHVSEDRFVDLAAIRVAQGSYLSTVSRNTREQIRRALRLYGEQFGEARCEVASDAATSLEWHEELVRLHQAHWRSRRRPGAFATANAQRFHRTLLERCAGGVMGPEALSVEIARVRVGDETIAVLQFLRFRGVISFYQSGLRYHGGNKLKPGLVAHALAIQHYADRGCVEYDFLAGEPDGVQYKRSLADGVRSLVWWEVDAATPKMRTLALMRRLRRQLRTLPSALRAIGRRPPAAGPS